MKNPLFEEQLRLGFINTNMVNLHLSGLGIISFIVFMFYPSKEISYFITRSAKPELFNIVLFSTIAFISYLTLKAAVFSIKDGSAISIKDWFLYTKIKVFTYLWGRVSYGLFYITFLVLLFLPPLLVSASVAAIRPLNLLAVILLIYIFILNLYAVGFFLYTLFKKQYWLLSLIIWFSIIILLFLGPTLFPAHHPALLLLKMQRSTDLINDLYYPLIINSISIIFLIFLSWLLVFLYSRRLNGQ